MIETMNVQIKMATGVFGRCETCLKNFYKSICAVACSPKQSVFLVGEKAKIVVENNKTGK